MNPNAFFELYLQEDVPTNSASGGTAGSAIAGIGQKGKPGSAVGFAEPAGRSKLKNLQGILSRRKKKNDRESRD